MLGLAKRTKARILQASTSEVYGDPETHPQSQEYWGKVNPIGPRARYDEGKRCAQTLFFDYRRQHGMQVEPARIFNTSDRSGEWPKPVPETPDITCGRKGCPPGEPLSKRLWIRYFLAGVFALELGSGSVCHVANVTS